MLIQSYDDAAFLNSKWLIYSKKEFFQKKKSNFFFTTLTSFTRFKRCLFSEKKPINNIKFMYLLAPFTVQNLNKILEADSELWGHIIYWPKWPIGLNRNFHRKSNNIFFIYVLFFFMQNIWRESLQWIWRKLILVKSDHPITLKNTWKSLAKSERVTNSKNVELSERYQKKLNFNLAKPNILQMFEMEKFMGS